MEESHRVAKLKYIELSNFKTFKNVQRIGHLERNFMAVIGSNGAGNNMNSVSHFHIVECLVDDINKSTFS